MEEKLVPEAAEILLFSNNSNTREVVKDAAGLSAEFGLPPIKWFEVATPKAVKQEFREGRFAALVLDAEVTQEGGPSVARYLKDHFDKVPPVVMLVARQQDEWMSRWSGALYCVPAPYEPTAVVQALKQALACQS